MRANIYADPVNYTLDDIDLDAKWHIGLEHGAYFAYQNKIPLTVALGDFDSLSETKRQRLEDAKIPFASYPARKDDTDTALAVQYATRLGATKIVVYGGLGDRLDHTYANLLLCKMAPVSFINASTKMYTLSKGVHTLKELFPIVSFFALEPVTGLSLKGFDYELEHHHLTPNDPLCISNHGEGIVSFEAGKLLVIESKEI